MSIADRIQYKLSLKQDLHNCEDCKMKRRRADYDEKNLRKKIQELIIINATCHLNYKTLRHNQCLDPDLSDLDYDLIDIDELAINYRPKDERNPTMALRDLARFLRHDST